MPHTALINNWLVAAMAETDQEALLPQLVRHEVRQGEALLRAGQKVEIVHFPTSCQVANVASLATGQSLAVSTVDRQGMTGLAAFMSDEPLGWDAVVHVPGVVWSMPAVALRERARESASLGSVLLHAAHQNQIEAHDRAVCAVFHPILARLARWLLTLQENTGQSSFALTQEFCAQLLGVRRSSAVTAFQALTIAGGLRPRTRGRVVIVDREVLRTVACDCGSRPSANTGAFRAAL